MKSIKAILGLIITSALATSCSDQMNYREASQYGKDYVAEAYDNVMGLMTYVYRKLDYDFGSGNYYGGIMLSSASDESQYAVSGSAIDKFWDGRWSPSDPISSMWSNAFTAITYCNEVLDEFQDLTFDDYMYGENYEKQMYSYRNLKWEARWARAYFYFNLVRQYGDVPLKEHKMTADESNQLSRTSADEIFEFINSECDAIKDEIIEDYSNVGIYQPTDGIHSGRPDKLAVLALKARAALYHASPLFNPNDDKELWEAAARAQWELLDYAVNKRGKKLAKTYDCLWNKDNYNGSEAINEIIFTRRIGDSNVLEKANYPFGIAGSEGGGNCPTQNLVDAYDMQETGMGIDETGSGYDPLHPYEGRDPRMKLTVAVNGEEKWPANNSIPLDVTYGGVNGEPLVGATPTGYYLKKLLHSSIDLSSSSKYKTDRHTWVIFRLAEFYLNYAEAVFQCTDDPYTIPDFLTGATLSPVNAVNVVRNRVQMPNLPNGLTAAQFDAKYKKERFVELAFEGHRFWDVRRWKEADKYFVNIKQMKLTKDETEGSIVYTRQTVTRNWDDKMYLFPIPASDLLKNPNLTQNPGW